VPAAQYEQLVFPAAANDPAGQLAHAKVVPGEYFPPAQLKQLVEPVAVVYCPATHAVQSFFAPAEDDALPTAHAVHDAAPVLAWNLPTSQLVQAVAPTPTVNMPEAQAEQAMPPVFAW